MVAPSAWNYVSWSTSFALPASSFCFVECLETRSVARKAWLLVMTFAPVVYGLEVGKAFYYGYVLVSTAIIACLVARRAMVALVPIALAVYVVAVPLASSSLTPGFFLDLVHEEEQEQSLGGTGGRDQLIRDGLGIWSRSPVLGVGPGNNYPYMLRYSALGTAHNQYVNILIELGAIGLVCFAVFAYQALRLGLALWRTRARPVAPETGAQLAWNVWRFSRRRILWRFHVAEHSQLWSGIVRRVLRSVDCPGSYRQRSRYRADISNRGQTT